MKNTISGFIIICLLFVFKANAAFYIAAEPEPFMSVSDDNGMTNDSECDTLLNKLLESLEVVDSLQLVIIKLQSSFQKSMNAFENNSTTFESLKVYSDSLKIALDKCLQKIDSLTTTHKTALLQNQELNFQILSLQNKLSEQNQFLEEQKVLLLEKELIIKEKEDIYKGVLTGSQIDLLKLEGKLNAKEQELQGKMREIDLISVSISEKQKDIEKKNEELAQNTAKREIANKMIDSLRDTLHSVQKSHILLVEENKYAQKEIAELRARLAARDKRDKQVAVVQGVALRTFRTPLWVLAPKSVEEPDTYVITNENAGKVEFDLVTGASVRVMRLSTEDAQYKFDLGWFVGFGGNNIFKNFYLGPNIKVFDFIHVNSGINFAEFRVLKDGFEEGKSSTKGVTIPTVNKWKPSFYFAVTFDFEIISQIASKF